MENQILQEDIDEKLEELNSSIQSCYNMPSDLQEEVEKRITEIKHMMEIRNAMMLHSS